MFHKGQLVRINPSKLHDAYPDQSESYLQEWYINFRDHYDPILTVDYVAEFEGHTVVHTLVKYLNGCTVSGCYRIGILVPVQEEDLDFIDIELFV